MANTTIKRRGLDGRKKVSSLPLLLLLLFIPHLFLLILITLLYANEDDNDSNIGRLVVLVTVVAKVMATAPEVLVVAARLRYCKG